MKAWRSSTCLHSLVTAGLWATILSALAVFSVMPAFAALGEDVSSVDADQAHMQSSRRTVSQMQTYTLHEIQSPTGTIVREYVSASGKVFAVAWQGAWPPDMRQILANYFGQYQQAAQAQVNSRTGRKPLVLEQPGIVIHAGGHMRSFAGRAYLPGSLPQGVSAEEIR